jgi:dihydroneopterin aldolase
MPTDSITLAGLKITSWVGVPSDERAHPQALEVSVEMVPVRGLCGLGDLIEHTIDYAVVARQVQEVAVAQKRRLIETLAEEIAEVLLAAHPLRTVTIEVRKFILPHCDHVAVRISKGRAE